MSITMQDVFEDLVKRSVELASFYGAYAYQVLGEIGNQVQLLPLSRTQNRTGELLIDKSYGVPGIASVLQPGSIVFVTWRDGDPGAPTVVGYLPGILPLTLNVNALQRVTIDATDEVRIGQNASSTRVGTGAGRVIRDGDTVTLPAGGGVIVLTSGTADTPTTSGSKLYA